MKLNGAALPYKSIFIVSPFGDVIRYQNPFDNDPYTQMTPTRDLCQWWDLETQIRIEELATFRKRGR